MKKVDRLEDLGIEDQLSEMQETSWLIEKILNGDIKIEMCYSYHDDEVNKTLQQFCGCIKSVLPNKSESSYTIEVQIMWNDDCIEVRDVKTKTLLKKKCNNIDVHANRSKREDTWHLLGTTASN